MQYYVALQKREQERQQKKQDDLARKAEKKREQEQKKHEKEMEKEKVLQERMAKNLKTSCYICKKIAKSDSSVRCIVCYNYMHTFCANSTARTPICTICQNK